MLISSSIFSFLRLLYRKKFHREGSFVKIEREREGGGKKEGRAFPLKRLSSPAVSLVPALFHFLRHARDLRLRSNSHSALRSTIISFPPRGINHGFPPFAWKTDDDLKTETYFLSYIKRGLNCYVSRETLNSSFCRVR